MITWLAVAIGGALGSMLRHAVNVAVHHRWPSARFSHATLIVNVVGCFVIGLLTGLLVTKRIALSPQWREFVFVGVLGGFTTFSTFGLDTFTLARSHSTGAAVLNVALHVGCGVGAVYAGYLAVVHRN
jgi:CrcB protein